MMDGSEYSKSRGGQGVVFTAFVPFPCTLEKHNTSRYLDLDNDGTRTQTVTRLGAWLS